MAEKRSQRIQVVLTLAIGHEDEAASQLGQYQQQVLNEEDQLAQLREYNESYIEEVKARRTGLRSSDMITYRAFLQRLSAAEQEQVVKISNMQRYLESLRGTWREKHQRRKSIEELIQRLETEESEVLEKSLQREMDELSAQKLQRRDR